MKKTKKEIKNLLHAAGCLACILILASCAPAKSVKASKVHEDATYHNQRGIELIDDGNYSASIKEFQKSLRINRSLDNRKGIVTNLLNIGRVYMIQERYDDARGVLEESLSVSISLGDKMLVAEASATMGKYYYVTGDNRKAQELIERAMDIDRHEAHKTIGGRLNILGLIHARDGKTKEAEEAFREALSQNLNSRETIEIANSYRGIGDILEAKGSLKDAKEYFEKALDNDRITGNSRKIANDLTRLGNLSLKGKETKAALDYFLRAYEVNINAGNSEAARIDATNITKTYREMGDEEKAGFYDDKKGR